MCECECVWKSVFCSLHLETQVVSKMTEDADVDLMQVLKNLCEMAGSLPLFNDVDVMNMGLDDVVPANETTSPVKDAAATQELLDAVEAKRSKMIRECDFMMRRLRKIQARMMGRHTSAEIYGVFEYAQQMIKRKERETKSISTMTPIAKLQNDKHKQSAGTSMKTLLKRIDQAAAIQQTGSNGMLTASTALSCGIGSSNGGNSSPGTALASTNDKREPNDDDAAKTRPQNVPHGGQVNAAWRNITTQCYNECDCRGNCRGKVDCRGPSIQRIANVVPPFDQNGIQQMKQFTGLLSTELKLVNGALDSDATASSSGGESADEMVSYNNATQQPLPM